MELDKIRRAVRSRFGFAVAIAVISFIAIFGFGSMAFMAEKDAMIKNTTIRGHSIAKILSILNEDSAVNRDPKLLERYTGEIGKERDIISIEIIRGIDSLLTIVMTGRSQNGTFGKFPTL